MIAGLIAGGAFMATACAPAWERPAWLAAAIFIQCRLIANMLDGMVAVASGKASSVGELYNEVPDRVSDTAILVGAGYAVGSVVTLGWAAAAAALFTAYIRAMGKAAGAKNEFCGPMAKQHRMAIMTVVAVFFAVAPQSWRPAWGLLPAALGVIVAGALLTALRRLMRIAATLRNPQ
jgi:phosphatidylglycerophosphate synthase